MPFDEDEDDDFGKSLDQSKKPPAPDSRQQNDSSRDWPDYKALLRREDVNEASLVDNPEDRPHRRLQRLKALDEHTRALIKESLNRKLSLALIRIRFISRLCVLARKSILEDDYFRPLNRRRFQYIDPGIKLT